MSITLIILWGDRRERRNSVSTSALPQYIQNSGASVPVFLGGTEEDVPITSDQDVVVLGIIVAFFLPDHLYHLIWER